MFIIAATASFTMQGTRRVEHTPGNLKVSAKDGKFGIHEVTQEYATETIDKIKKRTFEAGTLRNDIQKLLQLVRIIQVLARRIKFRVDPSALDVKASRT